MEEGVLIELQFSHQALAEMSGTTIFTVSRVLNAWEKKGLITAGREWVILTNPHVALRLAEGLGEGRSE